MAPVYITWFSKLWTIPLMKLSRLLQKYNVSINPDNTVTVEDDGRGIPVDMHKGEKMLQK